MKQHEAHTGSVSRRCPDTRKAERLLGYNPKMNWKTGVKATVKWYVDYIQNGGEVFE